MNAELESLLHSVVNPNRDIDVPALSDRVEAMLKPKGETFTQLEMEAALCVWECLNDWTLGTDEQIEAMRLNVEEDSHNAIRLEWIEMREGTGSAEMRAQSVVLGKWCLEIYDILTKHNEDFFSYWSYDWEVIPLMLKYAASKDGHASMYRGDYVYTGGELIDPFGAAQLVAQEIIWWTFRDACKAEARKQWCYEELVTDDGGERMRQSFAMGEEPAAFVKWLGEKFDLTPASGYF